MRRYLPDAIDITKLIHYAEASHIKGFHPYYLLWILSEICEKPTTTSGFVEIHSKRFQSMVHEYKYYLEFLAAGGIIELDKQFYYSYFSYSKVRGYRFTGEYSSTLRSVDIDYLPIVKKATKEKQRKLKTCKECSYLVTWFNPELTIDYDSAISYLSVYYAEKKKEQESLAEKEKIIRNTWYEDYSVKYLELQGCKTKNPYDSYKRAFMTVDKIKEQDYCLSTDGTVNRFYSTITLMSSDFRNFLRYDGKELVCLDIRNSQAFFSLGLLKEEKIGEIIEVEAELNKRDSKLCYKRSNQPSTYLSSSIILVKSLQHIDSQEIGRYKNLVLSGRIYDYFEQALKEELLINYPSRKALKKEFFRVLYSSNKFLGQPAAAPKRAFQKLFPGIFEYFSQLKRLHLDIIPIVLMRWESYAVLQCITKRIARDYPEVPLFTIHDGIVTTKDNVNLVSSIICEELNTLTGYSPVLKPEEWNLKNLKYYDKWRHNQT